MWLCNYFTSTVGIIVALTRTCKRIFKRHVTLFARFQHTTQMLVINYILACKRLKFFAWGNFLSLILGNVKTGNPV